MEPKIYLMSDIHGDFRPVRDFWLRAKLKEKMTLNKEDQVLIITGDFGANFFFNYRDENFKEKLGKYPFTYFVIRGNHEERPEICAANNPNDWTMEQFFGGLVWVEKAYPYIKYTMDTPTSYTINGYNTLVFPGAYSVDKYHRLQMGWSWFQYEQLDEEEMEAGRRLVNILNANKCDLVLSHTCPIIYEPTDLFLSCVDQSMVDKSMERYLGEIEYNLDYRAWCWGHYHQHREYPSPDGRRRLMLMHEAVRLEDVMEAKGYVETL
jgi:3-oxoacid CoA-transferase subunit A